MSSLEVYFRTVYLRLIILNSIQYTIAVNLFVWFVVVLQRMVIRLSRTSGGLLLLSVNLLHKLKRTFVDFWWHTHVPFFFGGLLEVISRRNVWTPNLFWNESTQYKVVHLINYAIRVQRTFKMWPLL